MSRLLLAAVVVLTAMCPVPGLAAPAPANVLLVVNTRHPFAHRVVDTYLTLRGVPAAQRVEVDVPADPVISRDEYVRRLERPIAEWLRRTQAMDRIEVIVLGPGLPLRIAGTAGRNGSSGSVDGEVALLYRRLTGAQVPASGFVDNPYFEPALLAEPRPFDRRRVDIYMVTRLDGRSEAEALALVRRGDQRAGAFVSVVDGRPPAASGPEARWLAEVGPRVQAARPDARVVADASAEIVRDIGGVTTYASWGSNDQRVRVPPVTFGPAAIASSFMSSDARTWAAPPAQWGPGTWADASTFFAGAPEALAADWLAAGLTGLGSQVAEPYLDGAFRPGTLAEAWARGYTLAESYYLALPYVGWQAVVFGDPLARAVEDGPAAPPADTGESPQAFLERAARVLQDGHPELGVEAAGLMARANLSIEQGKLDHARQLLEQVSVLAPRYLPGQLLLGQQYERAKQHELARARYELVLRQSPANVVALNNLAYSLGVLAGRPQEALPYAERAGLLGSDSAAVLDTLGWIRHLAGNSRGALAPLRRAVQADESLCEAWEHLATVEAAAGTPAAGTRAAARAEACHAAKAATR